MKKVLSLILALAMVFSCVPFAFAEGEAEGEAVAIPDTFDLAEAFAVDYEFTGDATVDYPNASLPAKGSDVWKVGQYGHTDGYENFSHFVTLHRAGNFYRAYEDDKSGDLKLIEGATYDKTRYPRMIWTFHSAKVAQATDVITWHWQGGAPTVYGDGGYSIPDANSYTGSVGYGFNTNIPKNNSAMGYQNEGSVHQGIRFIAPKAGLVRPTLEHSGNVNIAFQMYKLDAEGNKTVIYPNDKDVLTPITAPHASVTIPEKWATGWSALPGTLTTRDEETVWVEEGDEIVLRYAAISSAGANTSFNLDYYKMDYITSVENDLEVEYRAEDRLIDIRGEILLPLDNAIVTVDEEILTEGSETGIYTLSEDYIDGTETVITIANGATTQTINVAFKEMVMEFDFGDFFKTTDTYTEDYVYPVGGQTPAMANDGSQLWSAGYYTLGASYGTITYFNQLARVKGNTRAYEDTVSPVKDLPVAMAWISTNNNVRTDETGWFCNDVNGSTGGIGYTFGQIKGTMSWQSVCAVGWNSGATSIRNQVVVFKAPRDGVINPSIDMKAHQEDKVIYRMDKIASDGSVTPIYPLPTDTKVDWIPTHAEAPEVPAAWKSGWAVVRGAYSNTNMMTQDQGFARVKAGDQIILRFAAINTGNTSYIIDSLKMTYTEQFGPDDELFVTSPMVSYEESYVATYPNEKCIDLEVEVANATAQGTVEYTVTGNTDILRETAIPGVYELTGSFNIGAEAAVVTAGYYSPGKSSANGDEPRFTTSTNVFVQPLSNTTATFNGKYDIFDLSEMSYEMDEAFVLPYYSNAAEREIYGVIDLGITEEWANATATISDPSKFEYLGNGRIRAIASHTWEQAGGVQSATESDVTVLSNGKSANLTSKRDKMSMGTPVVMTVTAVDGGVRKFGLWSFPATVQNLDAEEADPNAYSLNMAQNISFNAVTKAEIMTSDGNWLPLYKDPNDSGYTPVADHRYTDDSNVTWRMGYTGDIVIPLNQQGYWDSYRSNRPFYNGAGLAHTFTAPKDGTIDLTGYFPTSFTIQGYPASGWVGQQMAAGNYIKFSVNLYDANDNLISTLWKQNVGRNTLAEGQTDADYTYMLLEESEVIDETRATQAEDEAKTLTFAVEKGQKVRVLVEANYNQGWGNYVTLSGGFAPAPVWTYDLEIPDEFTDYSVDVTPTAGGLTTENVLTLFYNEAGELVSVSRAADEGSSEDGYISVYLPEDAEPTYAKIFFWDSLGNIKPLAGNIVVRK